MKIKWFGHACFLFTSSKGIKVLADPFDKTVGYNMPEVEADIVTVSHNHHDHNYLQLLKGDFKHISKPGNYEIDDIRITGIPTWHDNNNGKKRGSNIVFLYEIDGMEICHMGDLGHIPTDKQIAELGQPDVLLIPVGGTYTIDHKEAAQVIRLMKPRLVIPMHYKTPVLSFPIDGLDKFAFSIGGVKYAGKQEIEINPDDPAELGSVLALDYK